MLNTKKFAILAITLLIVAVILLSNPVSAAGLADSAQPKFHHDQNNTGQSVYNGPQNNETKWNYTTNNMIGYSSPSIDKNGTVYVGSGDGYLYAFTSAGKLKWRYKTGDAVQSSPTIDSNGNIYFGSCDNWLYVLTSAGKLKWRYKTGSAVESSPTIDSNGNIYFGSCDGKVYALNSTGKIKWKYQTGNFIISSPALGSDGTIYVGSEDQYFYAISSAGKLKWRYKTGKAIYSDPVIHNGTIYTGSGDGYLYALTSAGKLKWKYKTGKEIYSLAAGKNGIIYVGNKDGKLYAINSSGKLQWTYTTGNTIRSSPTIGSNGTIYFGSYDGKLYALNSSGKLIWQYQTGSGIEGSPAITSDGTLYFGSHNSKFYAIQDVYVYATPKAGSYNKSQKITLTTNRTGIIYYTLNGTTPTTNSAQYTKAISITNSTTVKCFAVDTAGYKSQIYTQKYTIETVPPTVVSVDPTNNKVINVANKALVITFSENIKAGSVFTSIKVTNPDGVAVKPLYKVINGKTLTLTRNGYYINGLTYTITLPTGSITDTAGNTLKTAFTSKFKMDFVKPTVSSVNPTNNKVINVANKALVITFSENIKAGSAFTSIKVTNPDGVKVNPLYKVINGKTLTLTRNSYYINGLTYTITLPTGSITDTAGNAITAFTSKFKIDTTKPKITSTNPANKAVNIPRNKVIKVIFNENIKASSKYWIELKTSNGTSVTIKKSINGKVLTITPTAHLKANTKYYLILHTGSVTDTAGNPLAAKTISFTTRRT
jgi:outer membrane protein assembly factor BamB/methionine-rich copper-binding protein CopC